MLKITNLPVEELKIKGVNGILVGWMFEVSVNHINDAQAIINALTPLILDRSLGELKIQAPQNIILVNRINDFEIELRAISNELKKLN